MLILFAHFYVELVAVWGGLKIAVKRREVKAKEKRKDISI